MVAKQFLGQLSEFQQDSENISVYLECVQIFFNANGIKEDKQKVPIFLNAVGAQTYALLRNLLSPAKPVAKSFVELQKALTDHFEPKHLVIAERFYFLINEHKVQWICVGIRCWVRQLVSLGHSYKTSYAIDSFVDYKTLLFKKIFCLKKT